ncbi:MAG: EAL domain-containing response regulator [Proteobacteria bacterium]|nr:EAL domain-containing response regulator [Pseudomonadota bacterium]MCP4920802.1 EAL domain-containing response regulator [Pseudomonadota bacterium]
MNHILIVDDDPIICRSLRRVLVSEGLRVVTASDGHEALRRLQEHAFDVAVVDYDMPGLDGLRVLSQIREAQPGCIRMLMTGSTDFPMIVEAVNRGEVLRVVEKPFAARDFLRHLGEAYASVRRMASVRQAQQKAVEESERSMLEACLREGFIRMALQPIINADDGSIFAYEALLRSSHCILDGPMPVLRVADRHDMMHELGAEVCRRAGEILDVLHPEVHLFINLAPTQLGDMDTLMSGLAPVLPHSERCAIEITERSRLQGIGGWEKSVEELQAHGFAIAVDDLGAGYNSLSVLADLQPTYIKIDMSIVRNCDKEPRKQRLVDLLVKFGDATGARVLGEGVETAAEAQTLRECGIHLLQGYHLGRPEIFDPSLHLRKAS